MGLLIIAVAGLLLTAFGLVAGLFFGRQGRRRNQLVVSVKSQPMIVDRDTEAGSAVSLRYGDTVVDDPYFITAVLECIGPKDITSADFDNGRAIAIGLGAPMVALLRSDGLDIVESYRATSIDVQPNLLPRGKTFIVSAITDGCPDARIDARLVDTDIVDKKPGGSVLVATARRLMPYSYSIAVILGAAATVVAALLTTAEADKLDDLRSNPPVTVTVTATP